MNTLTTLALDDYLLILSSIVGLLIFIYSAMKVLNIMSLLPKESKTRSYWLYAILLIVLFGLGYLFSIVAVLTGQQNLLLSIIPVIYIFGAIFVLIVVMVSLRTYKAILESSE